MSTKELLYIEDALSHIQFLTTQCQTAVNQLQDPALKEQDSYSASSTTLSKEVT